MDKSKLKVLVCIMVVIDLAVIGIFLGHAQILETLGVPLSGFAKKAAIETPNRMGAIAGVKNTLSNWPPKLGENFPDVPLIDHNGHPFSLRSLFGKPTLIEFVAMTCAACEAWSGAHKYGAFENLAAQGGLDSIEKYYHQYTGGLELFDGKINFVQLIIYNSSLNIPSADDLIRWRTHFHFNEQQNVYIVTGGEALANQESFNRIPGFLLLDREGKIRFDALGHTPIHNLYTELLPAVSSLM